MGTLLCTYGWWKSDYQRQGLCIGQDNRTSRRNCESSHKAKGLSPKRKTRCYFARVETQAALRLEDRTGLRNVDDNYDARPKDHGFAYLNEAEITQFLQASQSVREACDADQCYGAIGGGLPGLADDTRCYSQVRSPTTSIVSSTGTTTYMPARVYRGFYWGAPTLNWVGRAF